MKKELIANEQGEEALEFISKSIDIQSENTYVLKTLDAFNINAI